MKELVRKWIQKLGLKKTRLYFAIQYRRQIKSLSPNLRHPDHQTILAELDREGIVVIPGFFTKEACDEMLKDLDAVYTKIKNHMYDGPFQYNHEQLIRTGSTDEMVPSTNHFFQHPFLNEIAKAYIDPRAYAYRKESELRDQPNSIQQADTWHFDDWRMRFKFFLYLTDVEAENAPFAYMKRTHKAFKGRKKKDIEYERDGETGAYGHFHPQEVRELKRHLDCEEQVCIAPAGTLIIADFRGLHKGTPLKAGRRVLLNATYGI